MRWIRSAGKTSPSGPSRSKVAHASPTYHVSNPRLPGILTVVDPQWSVVITAITTVVAPRCAKPLFQIGSDECGVDSLGQDRLIRQRHRFRLELEPGVTLVEEMPLGVGLAMPNMDDRCVRGPPSCEQPGDVPFRAGVVPPSPNRVVECLLHIDDHEGRFLGHVETLFGLVDLVKMTAWRYRMMGFHYRRELGSACDLGIRRLLPPRPGPGR